MITLVSSTRGDKGNPAARCALFRVGAGEKRCCHRINLKKLSSVSLSVCLSPCQRLVAILSRGVLTSHLPPRPPDARGNPGVLGRCLAIHTTAGLLLVCCVVAVVSSLSLSLSVSRLLPNSTSYTQKRASEPVRLVAFAVFSSPPFMRRPSSSSSSSVCSRLAVIVRSASETRRSPPTERRSLSSSSPPSSAPTNGEAGGAEGARIR